MEENFVSYPNGLFIDPLVVSDEYFDVCCLFASCWDKEDFADFAKLLDDKAEYVQTFNRKTFKNKENIVSYWDDFRKRVKQQHVNIRLSVVQNMYWNRAAIYLIFEEYVNMLLLFGINHGKIKSMFQSPDEESRYVDFSIYFGNRWAPLSSNYIKETLTYDDIPQKNHTPCLHCCTKSNELKWYRNEMTITDRNIVGLVSMCPECERVVEYIPKSINVIDSAKPLSRLTPTLSDFNSEKSFDNPLSEDGIRFHQYIKIAFYKENQENMDKSDLFNTLNALSLCPGCKLGSQKPSMSGSGGETSLFISSENGSIRDKHIFNHIFVEKSIRGAWQAYLLDKAPTILPVYWHAGYIVRKYIFIEDDVKSIPMLGKRDMSGLQEILYPSASFVNDNNVQVKCCYWNDWEGLVAETVDVCFDGNRVTFDNNHSDVLLPYHCGILF